MRTSGLDAPLITGHPARIWRGVCVLALALASNAFATCGDGTLDPGEQCDGNTVGANCCSASCQFESAGSPCGDRFDFCGVNACDGAGNCVRTAKPDGVQCNDGDACTLADTCASGACVGGPPATCGADQTCNPQLGCSPSGLRSPKTPRKIRIDCRDGVVANQPIDPLCDGDQATDGFCTFLSRCPICAVAGCVVSCYATPQVVLVLPVGHHRMLPRPGGRKVIYRCRPANRG
ncbi:MAG TPA: hypothetical protein VE911_10650 [Candidatus Nitrosopolaris sp.]|nr:hypothetical protein [Candidatus Nitrosopolaris sp.]